MTVRNERTEDVPPTVDQTDLEFWVLTTQPGQSLLERVSAVAEPLPADLTAWRKTATPEQVSAAIRLAEGRRRGRLKFARADRMWFDAVGLEQATLEAVAHHKAARFTGQTVFDLCCGIGGDAIALASRSKVAAVDLDRGRCRRTTWNAAVYDVSDSLMAVQSRAETVAIPAQALVHVDPDRRTDPGRRAKSLDGYQPALDFLKGLIASVPGGAIKLGPASDFGSHFVDDALEIEIVSANGECKEATVWFGRLASCRRRATNLSTHATWTDRDGPIDAVAPLGPLQSVIFDPDPALIRSGLLDGFAQVWGLHRIEPRIDLLAGDRRIPVGLVSSFEVLDILPMDRKQLRGVVERQAIGTLEIKTRGVEIRPESLRNELRPSGPNEATLFILRAEPSTKVILARRLRD